MIGNMNNKKYVLKVEFVHIIQGHDIFIYETHEICVKRLRTRMDVGTNIVRKPAIFNGIINSNK